MMLKILDKYIIKKYISAFFFIVLLLSLVVVVIDSSEKLEDYISAKLSFWQILTGYIIHFIPYINGLLFPLYALIAVVFFTSKLAGDSEFIAMIGSGVSYNKLLKPYLMGGAILAVFNWVFANFTIPEGNKKRVKFENTFIYKRNFKHRVDNIHLFASHNSEVYIRALNPQDSSARDVELIEYDGAAIVSEVSAEVMNPKGGYQWTLRNYKIRTFKGINETLKEFKGQTLDTTLAFGPNDLIRRTNFKDGMTTPELIEFIALEKKRGLNPVEFEVELQRRTSDPFSILILTVIGFSTASRKNRGGMGINLLIGVALAALYVMMSKFSTTFAIAGGLGAAVGTWLPNIVFAFIAAYLLTKAQK